MSYNNQQKKQEEKEEKNRRKQAKNVRNDHKLIFVKLNYLLLLESCEMKQLHNFDKWNKRKKKSMEKLNLQVVFVCCLCPISTTIMV